MNRFFWVLIGRVIQVVCTIAGVRLCSIYLSADDVGRLSLMSALAGGVAMLTVNPVGMYINGHVNVWKQHGLLITRLAQFVLYLVVLGGLLVVAGAISAWWQHSLTHALLLGSVALFVICNSGVSTFLSTLNILHLQKIFSLGNIFLALLLVSVPVVVVKYYAVSVYHWYAGLIGAHAIAFIAVAIALWRFGVPDEPAIRWCDWEPLKPLLAFAIPLISSAGLYWVTTQGYRFLVERMLGLEVLGRFFIGYGVSVGILSAFESVIVTFVTPKFLQQSSARTGSLDGWNQFAGVVLPMLLVTVVFVIGASRVITPILLAPSYHQVWPYVAIGACIEGLRVVSVVYSHVIYTGVCRARDLVMPSVYAACTTLTVLVPAMSFFGAPGIGLGLLSGGGLPPLLLHQRISQVASVQLPWGRMVLLAVASILWVAPVVSWGDFTLAYQLLAAVLYLFVGYILLTWRILWKAL